MVMGKTKQVLGYILVLICFFAISIFALSSCGNPRKGLYVDFEISGGEHNITYDSDGKAYLSLTKEFDENGNLKSSGIAELKVRVLKGDQKLLRTITVSSSDESKVGYSLSYDSESQTSSVTLTANGATANNQSTYIQFTSNEDSSVFARLYVRVDEKATSMNYADNLEIVTDKVGNIVIKNLGLFENVPFNLISNKLFKFGPSQATVPNLVYSVRETYNFRDGNEIIYSSTETGSSSYVSDSVTYMGEYEDGTVYKAVEFNVYNQDDKDNKIFVKKFRIPVYTNLNVGDLEIAKVLDEDSNVEIETLYERVNPTPANERGYYGYYVYVESTKTFELVTNTNYRDLMITPRVTTAYKKAKIDTQISFVNNKDVRYNNITVALSPVESMLTYSYSLVEPESSYTLLTPQTATLNRQSAYYGKYLRSGTEGNYTYTQITEQNFSSLGIIVGRTNCYSYSRTVNVVQNTTEEGVKTNSFKIVGWRESLEGTYLTFKANYSGFLEDDEITVVPSTQKTILIKVLNYPTQMYVNNQGVTYSPLVGVEGFSSLENFLDKYYFRTGENESNYSYTLITKYNYDDSKKEVIINGTAYPLDYENLGSATIYDEAKQEMSVFDVYNEINEQTLFVELNGYSDGLDEFYFYADKEEINKNADKYRNVVTILGALRFLCDGEYYALTTGEVYNVLEFSSGQNIFISSSSSTALFGEVPVVVEAKYNVLKPLKRKLILRFVPGVDSISAEDSSDKEITREEGVEISIPPFGGEITPFTVYVTALPANAATYKSLVDGKDKTFLSVSSKNTSVAKVGYYDESLDMFIENEINPKSLTFMILAQGFGKTDITIKTQNGTEFSFKVSIKEVVEQITLNLNVSTVPENTIYEYQNNSYIRSGTEYIDDEKQTLSSLMVEENKSGIEIDINVYPENAILENVQVFYLTKQKYGEITEFDATSAFEVKSVLASKIRAYMLDEGTISGDDGIEFRENRNVLIRIVGKQKAVLTTYARDLAIEDNNKSFPCIAFLYKDEAGVENIILKYFEITLYKGISGFVSQDGIESITLFSTNSISDRPYLESRTDAVLSVDITPASGTNITTRNVIWYFVDEGGAILRSGISTNEGSEREILSISNNNQLTMFPTTQSHGVHYNSDQTLSEIDHKIIPEDILSSLGSNYSFMQGSSIKIMSGALGNDNSSVVYYLQACIVDLNKLVKALTFTVTINKVVLVENLSVFDYDEEEGFYFESSKELSLLPKTMAGTVEDRLARLNSTQANDLIKQKEYLNISISHQEISPTLGELEYILLDAEVDENGVWKIDSNFTRKYKYSSSNIWLGYDSLNSKYFITPINYGYSILYVIPQDELCRINYVNSLENINPTNIADVINSVKKLGTLKEFHITVADGYKTYIRLSSAEALVEVASNYLAWDKNYYLMNDIDLNGVNLNMIGGKVDVMGTETTVPFSGKIVTMPIVATETALKFEYSGINYYIFDNTIYLDVSKRNFYGKVVDGLLTVGGKTFKIVDNVTLVEQNTSGTAEILSLTKQSVSTSIIPTHTIYGINQKLTDQNGNLKLQTENDFGGLGEAQFSYYGLFGLFCGTLENINFRFENFTVDGEISSSSGTAENIYVGALIGKIYNENDYSKHYSTIEGYYGKYVNGKLITKENALEHILEYRDGAYTAEAFFRPTLNSVGIFVQDYSVSLHPESTNLSSYNLYVGSIGQNYSSYFEDVSSEVYAELLAQEDGVLTVIFGGLIGLNYGEIGYGTQINTYINLSLRENCSSAGLIGGAIGQNENIIYNFNSSGEVKAFGLAGTEIASMGGICGTSSNYVKFSNSSVVLAGGQNIGGICGVSVIGIDNCVYSVYAGTQTAITGINSGFVGGLVGVLNNAIIEESYVINYTDEQNEILKGDFVGGLVGKTVGTSSIKKTFFIGTIYAKTCAGFVAKNEGTQLVIENCFARGNIITTQADDDMAVFVSVGENTVTAKWAYSALEFYVEDGLTKERTFSQVKIGANCLSLSVYYLYGTSTGDANSSPLTEIQMTDKTETTFVYNSYMTNLQFYDGDSNRPWTVTEQNKQMPILRGLYPTIPTDIQSYAKETLSGVYKVSDTEIIIALNEFKQNNLLTQLASNLFDLQIFPNNSLGEELSTQNARFEIIVGTTEVYSDSNMSSTYDSYSQIEDYYDKYYKMGSNFVKIEESKIEYIDGSIYSHPNTPIQSELRKILLNVKSSNISAVDTISSNIYDLRFVIQSAGTTTITLSALQNLAAKVELKICVIEGFDSFSIFDGLSELSDESLTLIQKEKSKRLDIAYYKTEAGNKKQIENASSLGGGVMIEFVEEYITLGSDQFREITYKNNFDEIVKISRAQILSEFVSASSMEAKQQVLDKYFAEHITQINATEAANYYVIYVDGYKFAKVSTSGTEKFVYAYYGNLDYITIYAKEVADNVLLALTKYYIFGSTNQTSVRYINTIQKTLKLKIYSGISSLSVSGSEALSEIDDFNVSDEFSSTISIVSDSDYDLKFGADVEIYLLKTVTIHANNTIVYDDEFGTSPQTYNNIDSYYGKFFKLEDESFIEITYENSIQKNNTLILILNGEEKVLSSTVDVSTKNRANTISEGFENMFIFGFETYNFVYDDEYGTNPQLYSDYSSYINKYYRTQNGTYIQLTTENFEERNGQFILTVSGQEILVYDINKITQKMSFALMQSYYQKLKSSLVFKAVVTNVDPILENKITKQVYFMFSPQKVQTIEMNHYSDAELEVGQAGQDKILSSNYLTNAGITPSDTILAGDYGLLQIKLNPDFGQFDKLTLTSFGVNTSDNISFVQRVRRIETFEENGKIITQIRYYLYDTQSDDQTNIVVAPWSDYDDGCESLMLGYTSVFESVDSTSTTTCSSIDAFYGKYFLYNGQKIEITSENTWQFNNQTLKIKVRDEKFIYDGSIYLQTLIAKQNTSANSFEVDLALEYDGETQQFSKRFSVDSTANIMWEYSGLVENQNVLVQEAYIAAGTQNSNLSLVHTGTFDGFSRIKVENITRTSGALTVENITGTNSYVVSARDASIGDKFSVTIIGYKDVNGYKREIERTINFNVCDFILKNNSLKLSESENDVLDKVYTSEAYYKIQIVPNFENIDIDKTNTEAMNNLENFLSELNTDKYQVFNIREGSSSEYSTKYLDEWSNINSNSTKSKYAFTKMKYAFKRGESGENESDYKVLNKSTLPKDLLSYYYIKYVYEHGENNGYYICPLSQGTGSKLYLTDIEYKFEDGKFVLTGGLREAEYDPATGIVERYKQIGTDGLFFVGFSGTELRFTQKTSVDNPIPIYTEEELLNMMAGLDYILMEDLTFNSWSPLNTQIASLDGNGKTIFVNATTFGSETENISGGTESEPVSVGFFGTVSSSTVLKNLKIVYKKMTNINLRENSGINFGLLAGTNNGIITNCEVTANNGEVCEIVVLSQDRTTDVFNVGGFVGVNNNSITNSRVSYINLTANGLVSGFVSQNNATISQSYTNFGQVKNSSTQSSTSQTAGFVIKNGLNAKILACYVGMAYNNETTQDGKKVSNVLETQKIQSSVDVGGFVYENVGKIEDSFSAISLTGGTNTSLNASSGGFVFMNQKGATISRCYTISQTQSYSSAHTPFVGPNKQDNYNSLNYGSDDAFKDCFFFNSNYGSNSIRLTTNLNIKQLTQEQFINKNNYFAECFDSYSVSKLQSQGFEYSSVWAFAYKDYQTLTTEKLLKEKLLESFDGTITLMGPQLVMANLNLNPNREVSSYDSTQNKYVYKENSLFRLVNAKTNLNVHVIDSAESFKNALYNDLDTSTGVLDEWYRLVCDIDISEVDLSEFNNKIFTGHFDGNGFTISGVSIAASKQNYVGLFGKIMSKMTGDYYADFTIASVHDLELKVNSITATEVVCVGVLCGEAENVVLSNLKILASQSNEIQIVGKNLVGGVAGKLYGHSRASNISSDISVSAVYSETYTNKLSYNKDLLRVYTYEVDTSSFVLSQTEAENYSKDANLCYAGAVFGVVDLIPFSGANVFVTQSEYGEARVNNILVSGQSKIVAGVAGGAFGLLGAQSFAGNVSKIVKDGTYLKGGRFAGGIVGENHGNLNNLKLEYEKTLQDKIDQKTTIGSVESGEDIILFAQTSTQTGEQAKAIGGLVGLNVGLSISTLRDVECGTIKNSHVKVRIDDETATFLGGICGISIGGVFNSNYITSSVVGERAGSTGGMIGYVTQFNDDKMSLIISNPFSQVENNAFNFRGGKYYFEILDNKPIAFYNSAKVLQTDEILIVTSGGQDFYQFVFDGQTFYLTQDLNKIISQPTLSENEIVFTEKTAKIYLGMDLQTVVLNNMVARNNYAYNDYSRISTIMAQGNGIFGALIGEISKNAQIVSNHVPLTGSYDPESPESTEFNFYVSEIYNTQPSYTTQTSTGKTLNAIGSDKRQQQTWESFVQTDASNVFVYIKDNKYKKIDRELIRENVAVNSGKFKIDGNTYRVFKDGTYFVEQIEEFAEISDESIIINGVGYDYSVQMYGEIYGVEKTGSEVTHIVSPTSQAHQVHLVNRNYNGTYEAYEVIIDLNKFLIENNKLYLISPLLVDNGTFTVGQVTYTIGTSTISSYETNISILNDNTFVVAGEKYYIDQAIANVYHIQTDFDEIATGLTRFESYNFSYNKNNSYYDRSFKNWNVYDYGTKQGDDTYKITKFDLSLMPIYDPTTDVEEIKIYTVNQFLNMKTSGIYRLMNDLDFGGEHVCLFKNDAFTGTFIGSSLSNNSSSEIVHTLYNLNPTSVDGKFAGIFCNTNGATIKNLNISGVYANLQIEDGTFNGNFGVLVGNSVDTTLLDINLTEDSRYSVAYVDHFSQTFEINNKLFEFRSSSGNSELYYIADCPDGLNTDNFEFTIGSNVYVLQKDSRQANAYSYYLKTDPTNVVAVVQSSFTLGENTYYIYKDKIFVERSQAVLVPISLKNLVQNFTIEGEDYYVEEKIEDTLDGNYFSIDRINYVLQGGTNIYTEDGSSFVSRIFGNIFRLNQKTYKLENNQITFLSINKKDADNEITISSAQPISIGGLVGKYEIKDLSDVSVSNINTEIEMNVSGGGQLVGGVVGSVDGGASLDCYFENIVFDGIITTRCGGSVGGVVGESKDATFASCLILGEMNVEAMININCGGFAGKVVDGNLNKLTYVEGITILNNMNITLKNNLFTVGGFAGSFVGRLYNSVIAPNINLQTLPLTGFENAVGSNVSGFVSELTPEALKFVINAELNKTKTALPLQNILILSTTNNQTRFGSVSAVYNRFLGESESVISRWGKYITYDQNLSLIEQIDSRFSKNTGQIFDGITLGGSELFGQPCYDDGEVLGFLISNIKTFGEEPRYPVIETNTDSTYYLLKSKYDENIKKGSKLHPKLIVEAKDVSINQNKYSLSEVGGPDGAGTEDFEWFVQMANLEKVSVLKPTSLNGFYNGNNHSISFEEIDGVYGFKTSETEVGLFKGATASIVANLSVVSKQKYNLSFTGDSSYVGSIASTMGSKSVVFACYSSLDIEVQNSISPISVGGLVGATAGKISSSGSNANLYVATSQPKFVGGLCGIVVENYVSVAGNPQIIENLSLINSFYNGLIKTNRVASVSGTGLIYQDSVGGLVGSCQLTMELDNSASTSTMGVKNCYSAPKMIGKLTLLSGTYSGEVSFGDAIIGRGGVEAQNNSVFYDQSFSKTNTGVQTFVVLNSIDSVISGLTEDEKQWQTATNANSNLPISVLMADLLLKQNIESDGKTYYEIYNEGELSYHLAHPQANAVYVLKTDLDYNTLSLNSSQTFVGTLDGNGYKISNMNGVLVEENRGIIKNIYFENNTSKLATTNFGRIDTVLLDSGTSIVGSNSGAILNSIVGTTLYVDSVTTKTTTNYSYENILSDGLDYENTYTIVGSVTNQSSNTGTLKLQLFNKTTNTLDLFGVDGTEQLSVYKSYEIETKEQYSALVQYLNRHAGDSSLYKITVTEDIDFEGINLTTLNGNLSVSGDNKKLENFSLANQTMFGSFANAGSYGMTGITFKNINFYAKSKQSGDEFSIITDENGAVIYDVSFEDCLMNVLKNGSFKIENVAVFANSNRGEISNISFDNIKLNTTSNNLALISNENHSDISNVTINEIFVNSSFENFGLALTTNDGSLSNTTVVNSTIASTNSGALVLGGIVGKNNNSSVVAKILVDEVNISGTAEVVGGVIAVNKGTLSKIDEQVNTISAININVDSNKVGGFVGENSGEIDSVSLAGETSSSIQIQSNNIVGGIVGLQNNGSLANALTKKTIITTEKINSSDTIIVGGLVGQITAGTISNIAVEQLNLVGEASEAGGVIGNTSRKGQDLLDLLIKDSIIDIDAINIGGLVGSLSNETTVSGSVLGLTISGTATNVGGLVGSDNGPAVQGDSSSIISKGIYMMDGDNVVNGLTINVNAENIGGILGINQCRAIINTQNNAQKLEILSQNSNALVGGVVGYAINSRSITLDSTISVKLLDNSNAKSFGGLVGKIDNLSYIYQKAELDVKLQPLAQIENLGGIVGDLNFAAKTFVSAPISIDLQSKATNAGGVVGILNNTTDGTVEITVESTITLNSTPTTKVTSIGGVVGLYDEKINEVTNLHVGGKVSFNISSTVSIDANGKFDNLGGMFGKTNINNNINSSMNNNLFIISNAGIINIETQNGQNVGGIVGFAQKDFAYQTSNQAEQKVTINSTATNIGGVVGQIAESTKLYSNINTSCQTFEITDASSSGTKYVGGIVGASENSAANISAIVEGLSNNFGFVIESGNPDAFVGGVIAKNNATITVAELSSMSLRGIQNVGVITGQNDGNIGVNQTGKFVQLNGNISLIAQEKSGLITGINNGTILGSSEKAIITDTVGTYNVNYGETSTKNNLGIVVSSNFGTMKTVYLEFTEDNSFTINSNGGNVGLLVGLNSGTIENAIRDSNQNVVNGSESKLISGAGDVVFSATNATNVGIIGLNSGTIAAEDITADHYSILGKENVGLIGKNTGVVDLTKSSMNANLLNGTSYVGAIGYNESQNVSSITSNIATIEGEFTGGVMGYNSADFSGSLVDGQARIFNSQITNASSASYLGGAFGQNAGDISDLTIFVRGTLQGSSHVGGIAGLNSGQFESTTLSNGSNAGITVLGSSYVGGLFGEIAEHSTFNDSSSNNNKFNVELVGSKNSSYVGAIAGINSGTISNVLVQSNSTVISSYLSIIGCYAVGGIVGQNAGTITNATNRVTLKTSETIGSATDYFAEAVGGIAGINNATITGSINEAEIGGFRNVGGIVGQNSGAITSAQNSGNIIEGVLKDDQDPLYMQGNNFGGLVGFNTNSATVSNSTFSGKIYPVGTTPTDQIKLGATGSLDVNNRTATVYNTGGFAGINEGTLNGNTLSGVQIFANTMIGGFAGINSGSIVSNSGSATITLLGIYSENITVSQYKCYTTSDGTYYGTNVYDNPSEPNYSNAIAFAIPIFSGNTDLITEDNKLDLSTLSGWSDWYNRWFVETDNWADRISGFGAWVSAQLSGEGNSVVVSYSYYGVAGCGVGYDRRSFASSGSDITGTNYTQIANTCSGINISYLTNRTIATAQIYSINNHGWTLSYYTYSDITDYGQIPIGVVENIS